MQYRLKSDEREFGLAKNEFIVCKDCKAVYFKKSWRHSLDEDIKHLEKNYHKKKIEFKLCPTCRMKKEKIYEGELILKNIPISKEKDALNLIKNMDYEAQRRDPLDRILWQEKSEGEIRFYISENQLTVLMGKKLKESLGNKGKLNIIHSNQSPVRVKLEFQ